MNTEEAVAHVLSKLSISKYRMSQDLGCAPILVTYWLTGTRMGPAYKKLFLHVYDIEVKV